MITNDKNRSHYPAVKSLPTLLRGIISNHHGEFYCLNCFHSYTGHNKLKKHERVCNNHDYCRVIILKKRLKNSYTEKKLRHKHSAYAWCSIYKKIDVIFIAEKIASNSFVKN